MKKQLIFLSVLLLVTQSVWATNGYFSHGYGIRYKGMAGAGVSLYQSAMSSATNPASLAFLGTRYDVNVAIFNPNRNYTVTGTPSGPPYFGLAPGQVESDNKVFVVPSLAANWKLNDKSAVGLAIYGNGGMNTEYPTKVFDNPQAPVTSPTGVNLSQMFFNATYARKIGENHSVAVSAIYAVQWFEATGMQAFGGFSSDPTHLTNTGKDNSQGFGFKIGYQGQLVEGLRIGASYQSRIKMSEFSQYAGLFAEQGSFDIPANWNAGISYLIDGKLLVAADVQQIMYSSVKALSNPLANLYLPAGAGALGADDGAGFGWSDMTILKVGVEYLALEKTTFRAGYSTALNDQPIAPSEVMFNILAPGVIKSHVSIGASQKIGEKNELSLAITRGLSNTVTGPNPMDPAQEIALNMNQWEFEIGFSF